jgi:uncharacterized protein with GYD domain
MRIGRHNVFMVRYVVLLSWTDKGIAGFQDSTARAAKAREAAAKLGARVVELFWTIGPYDLTAIVEFPDDESFTAWALGTGAGGNVRTTSLRAYDETQFAKIAGRAG